MSGDTVSTGTANGRLFIDEPSLDAVCRMRGICLAGYLAAFTGMLYPFIPAALGEGRLRQVEFLVNGEGKLPGFLDPGSIPSRSKRRQLLLETADAYVIAATQPGEGAIQVSRDLVGGMVVLSGQAGEVAPATQP